MFQRRATQPVRCSVVALCFILAVPAGAENAIELAAGRGSENIDALRLAWQRSWDRQTVFVGGGLLSGFHVLSVNRWWNETESITALGYSPVFTYQHNGSPWYFKAGIGVAYLSDTQIAGRILSTRFQFEDQLGIGWQHRQHDLSLVYRHYSNAGIEKPNHGIDLVLFSYALQLN